MIEAEARAKALERWAATDARDPDAIAETLRTGLFPALQEVAERSLSAAEEAARQREAAQARAAAEEQARIARERAEAEVRQRAEQERIAREKAAAEQVAAKYGAEGRIKVDAAIFSPRDSEAAQAGWLKPGAGRDEWFKDLDIGPEMVVVPGNPAFAIGRFAVTFSEWDAAQAHPEWEKYAKIAPRKPNDYGWGRGKQPAIDVSWNDAKAYCAWASAVTGKTYRLPSEAEWEQACRAGTKTEYWWGNEISTAQANYNGNYTFGNGKKGEYRKRTMPVDSFDANPWGLYQVHGNVWEWCEDAYDASYSRCSRRVLERRQSSQSPLVDPLQAPSPDYRAQQVRLPCCSCSFSCQNALTSFCTLQLYVLITFTHWQGPQPFLVFRRRRTNFLSVHDPDCSAGLRHR